MTAILRTLGAAALALAAPLLVLATYVMWRDRMPEPLPVHWGFTGEVDGTAGQAGFFAVTFVLAAVLALGVIAVLLFVRPAAAGRALASIMTFAVWICGGVWLVTATLSTDAARAADVRLPWPAIVALMAVPALLAVATFALLPGRWGEIRDPGSQRRGERAASTLSFAPGEAVMWMDQARAGVMTIVSGVLVAGGLAALLWIPPEAAAGAVIAAVVALGTAVLLAWMSRITVRIDEDGVHTMWGPCYWPRSVVPLDKIASVRVTDIRPMQWGGWGYRVSTRGTATVIKAGPGLVISRQGSWPDHAITLPHAAEGAEVLQALLARRHGQSAS